jgi:hypothetical protein
MPRVERDREIRRRRQRATKVRALRERLTRERDSRTRARLLAKLQRISPGAPVS